VLAINLLTVCTEKYPLLYAEKIIKRMLQVSNLNITSYCLTDRPHEINGWAKSLPRKIDAKGWWNKTLLFDPEMPAGWNVYLDIDIVILKNFDEEIRFAIAQARQIAAVSDAVGWMNQKFSSSLMIFKTGALANIFHEFCKAPEALYDRPGGDQVWMGPYLDDVCYLDETYPNLKRNLKFHIAARKGNDLIIPTEISDQIKSVDCTGQPKPHELAAVPYIYANWHMVR